jgi:hypothetical protein
MAQYSAAKTLFMIDALFLVRVVKQLSKPKKRRKTLDIWYPTRAIQD